MTAPLTVIIPTLNAADDLPATTDALLSGITEGLIAELVISDGGSTDQIEDVADALGAKLVTGEQGRGAQIARGIAKASTPWLLILHADTHLSQGWTHAAQDHMEHHADKAGWFRLVFRADGIMAKITAKGANLRARLFGLPYGDQGLLIHRDLLDESGGYPELPLMEDVILARQLEGRLSPLNANAMTSAERYETEGWIRRSLKNLGLLARFRMGARPETLMTKYTAKIPPS